MNLNITKIIEKKQNTFFFKYFKYIFKIFNDFNFDEISIEKKQNVGV